MQLQLNIQIPPVPHQLNYNSKISLFGSCFTENIWNYFQKACFTAHYNSHGIIFNPLSVSKAISDVIQKKEYTHSDLFYWNEIYHSWYHHSDYSDIEAEQALLKINNAIHFFHEYVKQSDYIIITLGSSFAYELIEQSIWVSNNHRAPSQWFNKKLLTTEHIVQTLQDTVRQLQAFTVQPHQQIVFTISPVRHIRDGVIDNNRSKARLIEAVHTVCDAHPEVYYFPAYEIVMDVLRDYRFFDIDMVHPNFAATQYVWEQFKATCITEEAQQYMPEFEALSKALAHKPFQPKTKAHQQFLASNLEKTKTLQQQFPQVDLQRFENYFMQQMAV